MSREEVDSTVRWGRRGRGFRCADTPIGCGHAANMGRASVRCQPHHRSCLRPPPLLPPSQSWKGSGAMGGCCWRPLHRWLQVQLHAWLITKDFKASDERSNPFLSRARRQKKGTEQRKGGSNRQGPGSSKESTGMEMSSFSPFPLPPLLFFLLCAVFALIFCLTYSPLLVVWFDLF